MQLEIAIVSLADIAGKIEVDCGNLNSAILFNVFVLPRRIRLFKGLAVVHLVEAQYRVLPEIWATTEPSALCAMTESDLVHPGVTK